MRKRKVFTLSILCCTISLLMTMNSVTRSQSNVMAARSAGLRGANVAEFGGVEALHQNPASLAFLDRTAFALSHVQGSKGGQIVETADVSILSDQGIGVAASLGLFHYGYLPKTPQRLLGYTGELAVGYEALEHFAVGAFVSLSRATSDASVASGILSSFGVLYAPTTEISYAMALNGIGTEPSYAPVGDSDSLHLESGRHPRSFQIAIAMRFPSATSSRRQFFGLSIANEKIIGQDGLIYRGGVEILPADFLALRLGYEVGPEMGGYASGIGLMLGAVRIDYALSKEKQSFLHYATVACEL